MADPIPLAIVTEEFRPSKKGGIATWAYELACQFSYNPEFQVSVFVKKRGGCDDFNYHRNALYKVLPMGGRNWNRFKKWYVRYYLRQYLQNYDQVIILTATWELAEGILKLAGDKHYLITAAHGLEVSRLNWSKYEKRLPSFINTCKKLSRIVAVSEYTKRQIVALGVSEPEKILIIPNGVDELKFYPANGEVKWEYFGLQPGSKVLLTLARLIPRKGQDTIIKALPKILSTVPEIVYVIAGAGKESWKSHLQELVNKNGLQDKVKFLGFVTEEEKLWLYQLASVYVMVSKDPGEEGDSEGFGITYLEANACGLPVIGSKTGGIPEVVKDNSNGLIVKPDDTEKITSALLKLLTEPQLYSRLSQNGRERVLKHYTWRIIASQYEKLFGSVIKNNSEVAR